MGEHQFSDLMADRLHEECGVVGISSPSDDVAQMVFFGLFALQHRGQEAAGIAVSDGVQARIHKDDGLVSHVFNASTLAPLRGPHGIGHTRYSTTGGSGSRNAQPFLVETVHGPLAVAHNGNLVNAHELRAELLARGFGLTASSDTEVMTLMLASAGGTNVGRSVGAHVVIMDRCVLACHLGRRSSYRSARPVGISSFVGGSFA